MKERLLWLSVFIIIVSSIGNYLYFKDKQIDKPIFLEHYIVKELFEENEMIEFTIYYLTNKQDPHKIHNVFIDGVDANIYNQSSTGWHFGTEQVEYIDQFNHHYLMSVNLAIWTDALNLKEDEVVSIKDVTFFLSNGDQVTANIGEILITGPPLPNEKEVIYSPFQMSSSDHFTENFFVATEPLFIESLSIPFFDQIGKQINIQYSIDQEVTKKLYDRHNLADRFFTIDAWKEFNVQPLKSTDFPISLAKDEKLWLLTELKYDRPQFTSFNLTWSGTTLEGDLFSFRTSVGDFPVVDQEYVIQLIKEYKEGATR